MNKKGSLELSIVAIVVIVIAFVVLGLGLTLTRTIFKEAGKKLPEAFAVTQLEAEPTPANPITISDRIEIGRDKTNELKIGYYNQDADTHTKVYLTITGCRASDPVAQAKTTPDTFPTLTSIEQDVGPSEAIAYKVILKENGLLGGYNYICTIAAVSGDPNNPIRWKEKQFFLYVTA